MSLKHCTRWILALALGLFLAAPAQAGQGIKVLGAGKAWPDAEFLDLSQIIGQASTLTTLDPNFPQDGVRSYTGIPLVRLLEMAGFDNKIGLTVIGSDQYVGYLTPDLVSAAMLVWQVENHPISGLKGGPLKVIFPSALSVHASCYTWYAQALVQGIPEHATLTVTAGKDETPWDLPRLTALSVPLSRSMFSIAQGCRNGGMAVPDDKEILAVPLSRLIGKEARSVRLEPFSGASILLDPASLAYEAFIMVSLGGQPIHPALGGPFIMVWPVEAHPELKEQVPESGALFFLETIVVN